MEIYVNNIRIKTPLSENRTRGCFRHSTYLLIHMQLRLLCIYLSADVLNDQLCIQVSVSCINLVFAFLFTSSESNYIILSTARSRTNTSMENCVYHQRGFQCCPDCLTRYNLFASANNNEQPIQQVCADKNVFREMFLCYQKGIRL